jgi:hypothetical protein
MLSENYCTHHNCSKYTYELVLYFTVMLQPFHYDPNEKNRHKFLVQSLVVPDSAGENLENTGQLFCLSYLWATLNYVV